MSAGYPYIEIPAKNLKVAESFFRELFGWEFVEYGPEYLAFNAEGFHGGFYKSDMIARSDTGSVLVILPSTDLEGMEKRVVELGGTIVKEIFSYPGGRRFQFTDPNGNEFSISETTETK